MSADRHRLFRVIRLVVIFVVTELALRLVIHFAPAMRQLMRPVYWIVAVVFALAIVHGARTRGPGHDRRHGERRHADRRGR